MKKTIPGAAVLNPVLELKHLVDRGWKLLPCMAGKKQPLEKDWPNRASSDFSNIQGWASQYPNCNWGVATGPGSGVFILDVDSIAHGADGRKSLAELETRHGRLPSTLTVLTGGGGEHRYFKYPKCCDIRNSDGSRNRLGAGLDVRGSGGLAIVPPSVHECGQAYRWLDAAAQIAEAPAWLLALVVTPIKAVDFVVEENASIGHSLLKTAPRFNAVQARRRGYRPTARFEVLNRGERSPGLFRYACALRRSGAERIEIENWLVLANQRCCRPQLPQAKIQQIAADVSSRYEPGGPDPLDVAWNSVESEHHSCGYDQFLALAWHLQQARPSGFSIALPLERICKLMGVDRTQVGRWRRYAVEDGWLIEAEPAIAHQRAASYFFRTRRDSDSLSP